MSSSTDDGRAVRIFRNGPVFTSDAAGSVASAVAVEDGRIVAVGGEEELAAYAARADEVVDLDGRMMLPGFTDAHAHPVQGGLERIQCDLTGTESAEECTAAVAAYARANPGRPWILGGGWSMAGFPDGRPTRQLLDAVVDDRPVCLPNRDHHSAWVNTRALSLAGIDASTPDPADGRIERDERGRPTGLLHEGAMSLVERLVPPSTQEDFDAGLRAAQDYLHSVGVVGWQDAMLRVAESGPGVHETYRRADAAGTLTAHVRGALWWERDCPREAVADQVAHLRAVRDLVPSDDRYRVGSVKIMQDGVAETFTAAMLDPYLDRCGHAGDNSGVSFLEPDLLSDATSALDAAGFQVHFHALGDRAVREVLDAIDHARQVNGSADRRHHLAHLQVVHPDDLGRFRRLGAIANLQALWAAHEPQMDELTIPFLGARRASWQYPFGGLLAAGAPLAMGSDWPVSSAEPLQAIHTAVNRISYEAPDGTPPLGSDHALPLAVALRAYTAGSAYVNFRDDAAGTIRVGADADLVVLDRDPFDEPASRIGATRVHRTYVGGAEVFRAG